MPFCELLRSFVIDKTRKVKFLYNIIWFPLWRKTTIQLKYTEKHKKKGASLTYDTPSPTLQFAIFCEVMILLFTLSRWIEQMRGELEEVLQALMKKNGITFFNMSGLSLKKLLNAPDHIGDSFKTTPNRSLGFGIKLSSSPLSLHIRCNLKPKYHPMVLLPLSA